MRGYPPMEIGRCQIKPSSWQSLRGRRNCPKPCQKHGGPKKASKPISRQLMKGAVTCPTTCRKHGGPPKTNKNQAMKRWMLSGSFRKVGPQQVHASRRLACLPNRGCACNQRRQLRLLCAPIRLRLADDIEGVLDIKAKAAPMLVDRLHQVRGVQIVRDGRLQVRDDQALPSRLQRLCKHCQHLAAREIDAVDRFSVDDQVLNPISPEASRT
mmetsp:Transcript_42013/g.132745  ORF Transcript_42013/g.132745 Transcript_42013/m.132745 type:complete len:212 (+) Transcript_42013:34-669(+)